MLLQGLVGVQLLLAGLDVVYECSEAIEAVLLVGCCDILGFEPFHIEALDLTQEECLFALDLLLLDLLHQLTTPLECGCLRLDEGCVHQAAEEVAVDVGA